MNLYSFAIFGDCYLFSDAFNSFLNYYCAILTDALHSFLINRMYYYYSFRIFFNKLVKISTLEKSLACSQFFDSFWIYNQLNSFQNYHHVIQYKKNTSRMDKKLKDGNHNDWSSDKCIFVVQLRWIFLTLDTIKCYFKLILFKFLCTLNNISNP